MFLSLDFTFDRSKLNRRIFEQTSYLQHIKPELGSLISLRSDPNPADSLDEPSPDLKKNHYSEIDIQTLSLLVHELRALLYR